MYAFIEIDTPPIFMMAIGAVVTTTLIIVVVILMISMIFVARWYMKKQTNEKRMTRYASE